MKVPDDLGFIHRFERGASDTTILLLHGTGGDEHDLVPLGKELAPDASLLSPRGQVLEDGMPRFFRRVATGRFDIDDLKLRTHDLAAFIADARRVYDLGNRVIALGYSNGANIAASLLLLHPGLLKGAALLHAMVPFEPEEIPDLSGSRILLTSGTSDQLIPLPFAERLADIFRDAGAEVDHEKLPGGHQLTQQELQVVGEWLDR